MNYPNFKLIIIGDIYVGKSAIFSKYINICCDDNQVQQHVTNDYSSAIGINFESKEIEVKAIQNIFA